MMSNRQLKDVLKVVDVLYITKKINKCNQTVNILEMFFNKVLESTSAEEAFDLYIKSRPSVIITDIDLPKNNGIDFIKSIRKTNKKIPIMIVSKKKDEYFLFEAIKLHLIDYLLYPIDTSKLINAINLIAKEVVNNGQKEVIFKNGVRYDYVTKSIINKNDLVTTLTKNEFRLLEFLIANEGKKVSKKDIETHLWADECITQSAFKSLFNRLRNKIGKDLIVNTFGVGYNIEL